MRMLPRWPLAALPPTPSSLRWVRAVFSLGLGLVVTGALAFAVTFAGGALNGALYAEEVPLRWGGASALPSAPLGSANANIEIELECADELSDLFRRTTSTTGDGTFWYERVSCQPRFARAYRLDRARCFVTRAIESGDVLSGGLIGTAMMTVLSFACLGRRRRPAAGDEPSKLASALAIVSASMGALVVASFFVFVQSPALSFGLACMFVGFSLLALLTAICAVSCLAIVLGLRFALMLIVKRAA